MYPEPEVRLSFVSRTSLQADAPQKEVRLSEKPDFEWDHTSELTTSPDSSFG